MSPFKILVGLKFLPVELQNTIGDFKPIRAFIMRNEPLTNLPNVEVVGTDNERWIFNPEFFIELCKESGLAYAKIGGHFLPTNRLPKPGQCNAILSNYKGDLFFGNIISNLPEGGFVCKVNPPSYMKEGPVLTVDSDGKETLSYSSYR